MSEILCHGLRAHFLFEQDCTIEGVGGQDTKAIKALNGKPADFMMNDKCSAGTGKFLEISAGRLGLELSEIYKTARKNPAIKISSTCTVFAESENVSLSVNGIETSEIAYDTLDSSAHKVASLIKRLENQIYFLSSGRVNFKFANLKFMWPNLFFKPSFYINAFSKYCSRIFLHNIKP